MQSPCCEDELFLLLRLKPPVRSSGNLEMSRPDSSPTQLADPNQVPRRETELVFCGYGPHLITESKCHKHIKRTTTGVVSIKIFKHLPSPIYKYKTLLLHLQIRARNLHVVNPYKCVGPAVCGCVQTSSPVPTRIKNSC